jgi:Protein of unknown function (DUF3828)
MTVTHSLKARFAVICALAISLASGALAESVTPQAFLEDVYRPYQTSDKATDISSEAKAARYFTPSLAHLIQKDIAQAAQRHEIGQLDFDPFIASQEWVRRKIALRIEPGSRPDLAAGLATFTPVGEKKPIEVRLDLIKTPAGWRIADIHWKEPSKSLVELLTAAH